MARQKSGSVPNYRQHRPSGQAVVSLSGQDFYLGPHGTKVSKAEYDRVVAEWLARGRRPMLPPDQAEQAPLTVVELAVQFKAHATKYYRKNGKVTSEVGAIVSAIKVLAKLYGREPAAEFGPLKLQAVQQAMIRLGWTRSGINKQTQRIVRMYRWGAAQELVKPDIAIALRAVGGLHQGRTEARESSPIMPVADEAVQQTLQHLPATVADMVRLQRMTGARPDEICTIRPCDVDTTGDVWAYAPQSHKTQHHGRQRVIFIGPRAQAVLRPYLLRAAESYCFSPHESEHKRRAENSANRKTPIGYGNRPGTNKNTKPARPAGKRYTSNTYRVAIRRACEIAFGMPDELRKAPKVESAEAKAERLKAASDWRGKYCWAPNQLRHSAATEIRKRFGLEATQVVLGHSKADVSQVYAERDLAKAASIMREVG